MPIYLERKIGLKDLALKKSLFLFGPRSTGKSMVLRRTFPDSQVINLLDSELFLNFSVAPHQLESYLEKKKSGPIIIDEVQRIPELLNEVHRLIEEKKLKFILTGSSARKLKRGHANMLAGRAWTTHLFPLTWAEIPKFSLERYLQFGGLPMVYLSKDPREDLKSYVETYLREEIQAEGLVRKIPDFSRFLRTAALCSGQLLNFEKIAQDAQVKPSTVRSYFEILEDTLIGFQLPPWENGKLRRAIKAPKFFLFDTGVSRFLAGIKNIEPQSDMWGRAFEQFIGQELRAYLSYSRTDEALCYWRSSNNHEVDFVIGDIVAIEVKATTRPQSDDLKGLKAIADEGSFKKRILVCEAKSFRTIDGIEVLPFEHFLRLLWAGELV